MNIVEIKAAWVLKFALHLHKLEPAISGSEATRIATETYPDAFDLAPEKAADNYMLKGAPEN